MLNSLKQTQFLLTKKVGIISDLARTSIKDHSVENTLLQLFPQLEKKARHEKLGQHKLDHLSDCLLKSGIQPTESVLQLTFQEFKKIHAQHVTQAVWAPNFIYTMQQIPGPKIGMTGYTREIVKKFYPQLTQQFAFDKVYTADEFEKFRPNPTCIQKTIQNFDPQQELTWFYIGDNSQDAQTGVNAQKLGLKVININYYGDTVYELSEISQLPVNNFISNWLHLLHIVQESTR